jgi:hypothetical protein
MYVIFQVLTVVSMNVAFFWDTVLCSLGEVDISEMLTASIIKAVMLMAVSTSEMSVNL